MYILADDSINTSLLKSKRGSFSMEVEEGEQQGTWVAQMVQRLTLGFGPGCDLMDCGIEPQVGLLT